ncbi:MAG TPA: NTP transferase domain-containing protein [Verrucomicrobiae bacterium]|nr:NTP transferase domain-containing protein [Verrucomicrobiae bacterium]
MNVAVILAAGESRRMGEPKQLLPFGDKTMLECVVDAFDSPKVDQTIVVLGHKADEIVEMLKGEAPAELRSGTARREARPPRLQVVKNANWRAGMFTSVQAGLRALPKTAKLVLVALCDQPKLKRATVERLVETFEREKRSILVPSIHGRQGHPLLFSSRYVKEILGMDEMLTLKHFLANHPDDIARLVVDDDGVLVDIDDPADYRKAVRDVVGRVPPRGDWARLKPPRRLRRLDSIWAGDGSPCFFLTICVQGRAQVLANEKVHVRLREFLQTSPSRYGWWPGRYVMMPDHVHLLVTQGEAPRGGTRPTTLGDWVKALKVVVSRREIKWQKSFFDHLLRSDESAAEKWEYIRQNPVRAGLAASADEWPYAGEIICESETEAPREGTRPTTE